MTQPSQSDAVSKVLVLRADQELGAALAAHVREHKISRSQAIRDLLASGLEIIDAMANDDVRWLEAYDLGFRAFRETLVAVAEGGARWRWTRVEMRASKVIGFRMLKSDTKLVDDLAKHAEHRGLNLSAAARDILRYALGVVTGAEDAGWREGYRAAYMAVQGATLGVAGLGPDAARQLAGRK